jgi:predicted O-methyltransferase YrrM
MHERFKKTIAPQDRKTQIPDYTEMDQHVDAVCYRVENGTQWYPPLMLSANALAESALGIDNAKNALQFIQLLDMDDYCKYLAEYYQEGMRRFGANWRYADIVTVLLALTETLKPKSYLEIGVRRGRSVCAVASKASKCDLYLFDMWVSNYAGMENPGPELVAAELDKFSHTGKREFTNGNSHETLKRFFNENPNLALDMVTVDGDHSYNGAVEDICDVLPRLKIGGAIVFDDICHPKHLYLQEVWQNLVVSDPRFTSWTCKEIGYGVGFALRKW